MSAVSVGSWELALQDSIYNDGLQMCKWKVGSLWPKAQDMGLSRPRVPGGTSFTVSWTTNTSESKPRDPNWPLTVRWRPRQSHFTSHPSVKGRDRASASLWPAGRPQEPGTRGKMLGGLHSTQRVPTLLNAVQPSGLRATAGTCHRD